MRQFRLLLIIFSVFIVMALVGCGGSEEPVVEQEQGVEQETEQEIEQEAGQETEQEQEQEQETEAEQASEQVQEASDDQADDSMAELLADKVVVEESGFSFLPPAGYALERVEEGAQLVKDGADVESGPAIAIFGGDFPPELTADLAYEQFTSAGYDEIERQELNRTDVDGFMAPFTTTVEGDQLKGQLTLLLQDGQGVLITAIGPADSWEGELAAINAAVIASVELFPIEAAAAEETAADSSDSGSMGSDDGSVEDAAEETAEETADSAAPVAAGAAMDDTPGMACFGSSGEGLTCLSTDGQWQQYTDENSNIGGNYIQALAECADGQILISHIRGLDLFDGNDFTSFPEGDYSSADAVACDNDGGFWVAHFEGVSYFDGSAWTKFESADLGGESLFDDVDVAPDGSIWVQASNRIFRYADGSWTTFEEGNGFDDNYFFDAIGIDAAGNVYAAISRGVLIYSADSGWRELEGNSYASVSSTEVDATGKVWFGTLNDGLLVLEGSGWNTIDRDNSELSSATINAIETDGSGRVWVGTSYGLNIWDGSAFTTYRMDNGELLSNDVEAIAILNGGPALPTMVEKENGSITGKLTVADAPYTDALVEVCVESLFSSFSGATPCEGQPLTFQTTTDANGQFTFEDLPTGWYVLVAETPTGWALLTNQYGFGSEQISVEPGEETDIGELFLEEDEG